VTGKWGGEAHVDSRSIDLVVSAMMIFPARLNFFTLSYMIEQYSVDTIIRIRFFFASCAISYLKIGNARDLSREVLSHSNFSDLF
jgi:hypothetical protein